MKTIGNIIWLFLGGIELALMWAAGGILCFATIIGIPFGVQCFKLAGVSLFPFGKEIVYGGGTVSFLANLLWIFTFGLALAVSSLAIGVVWCCTVVGIPFGLQCFKLAKLSLLPFGAEVR